jgi:tRNA dimethylallyltransferase
MNATPVLIYGPTASGKSTLALRIAERDGGCIINADASQVYSCWRVLTARPSAQDLARAPHRLFGHVSCATRYSVGAWLRDAADALAEARASGQRPIVVGGTGLYFMALTEGLAAVPETPREIRARSEAILAHGRLDLLLAELAGRDPETFSRIDRANPRRVQRAWEVVVATGRGLSDWQRQTPAPVVPSERCIRIAGYPDIAILNNNIRQRLVEMLEDGALDECRRFLVAGHDATLPAANVLGASPLFAHLRGEIGLDAAIEAAVTATRQFAKRQRTWLRNRMPDWTRLDPAIGPLDAIPTF